MEKNKYCAAMRYYFEDARIFYGDVAKLCKKNAYNLVLHKHLGDVFYAIAAKPFFEAEYNAPLHFIVRPQHEFLMKMFGIKNYSLYDLDSLVKKNNDFKELYFNGKSHDRFADDRIENEMFQALFPCIPGNKGTPFVCENLINNFFTYDDYWAYRWSSNMGLNPNFKFLLPQHKPELSKVAKKKLEKIAPFDKIVLFAPEAATFPEFAPDFWNIIADKMHDKGYRIIVNSKKIQINHGISAFDLNLSLQDVVALGLNCAYVFSLRSGLCDVLVGAGSRLYAFYPAQGRREMYSLTKPFATNTGVNEIQIWNWKIDNVICEDIDFTPELQKHIDGLRKNYRKETLKRIFSTSKYKPIHAFGRNLMRDLAGISRVFPENNLKNPQPIVNKSFKPFYSKTIKVFSWATETKYSFLNGFLTYKKDSRGTQRLRLCGIVLYSKTNKGLIRTSRLLWIPFHRKDIRKEIFEKIITNVDPKHDGIYISRHNIGETYVYLSHLQKWVKKNGSKKPVVIVWQKKDFDFYKMFTSKNIDLQYIEIPQQDLFAIFTDEFIEYKGRKIFCPTPDILQNMLKIDTHPNFYQYICKDFEINDKSKIIIPRVDPIIDTFVQNRIKTYFKKPFIVLIPDATSLKVLPSDFWDTIIKKLKNLGYDIFVNSHSSRTSHNFVISDNSTISFDTTVGELFALAKHSAGVISMASGIAVLLTGTNTKMDLIYTDFNLKDPYVNSAQAQEIYSVYYLPNIDKKKIKEYDANLYTEEQLIDLIIKRYKK